MKNRIFLIVCCLSVFWLFAQNRNYLLYADRKTSNLKKQILVDNAIKTSWEEQLKTADELIEKDRFSAADCQVLGSFYRMTGNEKYAEAIKTLNNYTSKETWEGQELLKRTPSCKGDLSTSHTSFYISIGFDCAYNYLTKKERKVITALVEDFKSAPKVIFQGQSNAVFSVYGSKNKSGFVINGKSVPGKYSTLNKLIQL